MVQSCNVRNALNYNHMLLQNMKLIRSVISCLCHNLTVLFYIQTFSQKFFILVVISTIKGLHVE